VKLAVKEGVVTPSASGEWSVTFDIWSPEKQETLGAIPGLRIDNGRNCAVGSMDAVAAACRALNVQMPKVVIPTKGSLPDLPLRAYQTVGVATLRHLLYACGGAILADDMGLGKTRSSIATARVLTDKNGTRIFIVCPASVR
jgi:hypothetical protein